MRIVLLCGDQSNQHALAAKVKNKFNIVGIVLESRKSKQKKTLSLIISKILDRIFFMKIASSWNNMLGYYKKTFSTELNLPTLRIDDINKVAVIDFIKEYKPDLVMVSGTSLLKGEILNIATNKGIINLHTGLSPYVKGGPNCTNWCIANNNMHLVGNTIMIIDRGIDSGRIITSEKVNLEGTESIDQLHIKVMESAHELYLKALAFIVENENKISGIDQNEVGIGQLYLTKMWNFKMKLRWAKSVFLGKYKKEILKCDFKMMKEGIKTIKLK